MPCFESGAQGKNFQTWSAFGIKVETKGKGRIAITKDPIGSERIAGAIECHDGREQGDFLQRVDRDGDGASGVRGFGRYSGGLLRQWADSRWAAMR